MENTDNLKQTIFHCLDFIRWQVNNDKCTAEEIRSLSKFLVTELNALASIDELSEFYGQSRSNVSNVLSRRFVPSRDRERVTRFRFGWFVKNMPTSWLNK